MNGYTTVFRFLCLLALPVLTGCSLAPDYIRPEPPVPALISPADTGEASSQAIPALPGWQDFYSQPDLRDLIRTSHENNRDLRLALIAVAEAAASYRVERADRFPQVQAAGSASYGGDFQGNREEAYQAEAGLSFSLDLFGRLRSLSQAAFEQYLATAEAGRAVRITLTAEVARAWLDLNLALEQLAIARQTLESRADSLAFVEGRVLSGRSTILELEQAASLVDSARADLAVRERETILARNALRLLTADFDADPIRQATPLERIAFAPLPGQVPSQVLLRRPDVLEAEHALRAANADIGAARAAFFPSISLTGASGGMSGQLSGLFSGTDLFWSFIPEVSLPLFSGGRNRAGLDLAELRKDSAVARYELTIQTAFREVADALQTREFYQRRITALQSYAASQQLVLDLAWNRYGGGSISYLEVLDAQRSLYQARQDLLQARRDGLNNEITLFAALSGGAEAALPAADPTR